MTAPSHAANVRRRVLAYGLLAGLVSCQAFGESDPLPVRGLDDPSREPGFEPMLVIPIPNLAGCQTTPRARAWNRWWHKTRLFRACCSASSVTRTST